MVTPQGYWITRAASIAVEVLLPRTDAAYTAPLAMVYILRVTFVVPQFTDATEVISEASSTLYAGLRGGLSRFGTAFKTLNV